MAGSVLYRLLNSSLPVADHGDGCYLIDSEGRRYLDACAGAGVSCLGHSEERVKAAVKAGVRSTPTFFINGRRIEGNMPFENWLMAFAVELDRS